MYIYQCPNCGNSKGYKAEDNCPACGYLHPPELNEEEEAVHITFCPECGCHFSQPCQTHQAHLRKKKYDYVKFDSNETEVLYEQLARQFLNGNPLNKIKP